MCTVLFSYKTTPGYRLVLVANRDEFLDRATAPLAYWHDYKGVLAGRDLQAGGTWLGLNTKGRIGAVTNFREPVNGHNDYASRGELLTHFLTRNIELEEFVRQLKKEQWKYRGFNLVIGDEKSLYYFSNRKEEIKRLKPGIYGLSNHLLDSGWPKVERGKMLFKKVLDSSFLEVEELFAMLCDTHHPPDEQLPDTGVGKLWERLLSPIFITSTGYGTRSSAVITIADNGHAEFWERTFQHGPEGWLPGEERYFSMKDG